MKSRLILHSIIAFLIGIVITTYVSYLFKNSLIESEKRKLLAVAHSSSAHIENYFDWLENAINTISASDKLLESFESFEKTFKDVEKESTINISDINSNLLSYYANDFVPKIRHDLVNSEQTKSVEQYIPKSLNGKILQNTYIINNPFNLGKKDKYIKSKELKSKYNDSHTKYQPYFLEIQRRYGFYDIFLIDKRGNIIYSIEKENDFATNLLTGAYSDSYLAVAYKKAIKTSTRQLTFEDFKPYEPSLNQPAAFITIPLIKNEQTIGVLAVQVPTHKIDEVMSFKNRWEESGLGYSGEAYLVGKDFLMRSNSRFVESFDSKLIKNMKTTVGIVEVKSPSVIKGLNNKDGVWLIRDYRGVEVYSAYLPISVFGNKWVVLAEIDKKEVMKNIESNIILLFILSSLMISLLILGFILIIQKYFIKPLESRNIELTKDVRIQEKNVIISQSLLNEYKKAVDASAIVSKTNRRGIITYVNDAFCEISGFNRDELIDSSHNITRHPDTPKETFADLWKTIKSKNIWHGVIKNQKKMVQIIM